MTSRRLVLLPAAAFSLAFRLSGWTTRAATELARTTPPRSYAAVRPFSRSGAVDELRPPARADRAPVSPQVHGGFPFSLPLLAAGTDCSSSSRFRQIPLSVGAPKALYSALQKAVCLPYPKRLGRRSLNPNLSLHGGVA